MTLYFTDHRPVAPALRDQVVEYVKAQGRDVSGLEVIAHFKDRERVDVQRAMQVAMDKELLHLTLEMKLRPGRGRGAGIA